MWDKYYLLDISLYMHLDITHWQMHGALLQEKPDMIVLMLGTIATRNKKYTW